MRLGVLCPSNLADDVHTGRSGRIDRRRRLGNGKQRAQRVSWWVGMAVHSHGELQYGSQGWATFTPTMPWQPPPSAQARRVVFPHRVYCRVLCSSHLLPNWLPWREPLAGARLPSATAASTIAPSQLTHSLVLLHQLPPAIALRTFQLPQLLRPCPSVPLVPLSPPARLAPC